MGLEIEGAEIMGTNPANLAETVIPEEATGACERSGARRRLLPSKAKSRRSSRPRRDRALYDMRAFHRSVDWTEWWERFFFTRDASGRHTYRTVRQFAKAVAKSERQLRFIEWYLGPTTDPVSGQPAKPEDPNFSFVTPQDWRLMRETGAWHGEHFIKNLQKKFEANFEALEALRVVGNEALVPAMERYERMAKTIDRNFNYGEFDPNLSELENLKRIQLWITFHERIEALKAKSLDSIAKSLGINFDEPASFTETVAASAVFAKRVTGPAGKQVSCEKPFIDELVKMILKKATTHGIPLPTEVVQKIIEVASRPEPAAAQPEPVPPDEDTQS